MIAATIQLCTYNRAALLERVLEACFDQTIRDDSYEVVLVDDGSSDETSVGDRARTFARTVRVYRRKPRKPRACQRS